MRSLCATRNIRLWSSGPEPMLRLLLALALLTGPLAEPPRPLARCVGADPCRACSSCKLCHYCNSGQGSCSVKREVEDAKYEARKRMTR